MDPVLVSSPETHGVFVPPILAQSENADIESRLEKRSRQMWLSVLLVSIAVLVVYLILGAPLELVGIWIVATLPILLYQYWNYQLVKENPKVLSERWLFSSWVYLQVNRWSLVFPFTFCVFGLLQLLALYHFDSNERSLELLGMSYGGFSEGEYWRALTGIFMHVTVAHWMVNFSLGIGIWVLVSGVFGILKSMMLMIFFGVFSFVSTYYFANIVVNLDSPGIVGISGGLAGLLGLLFGSTLRWRALYPLKMFVSVGAFAAVSLLLFTWTQSLESMVCHFSGFSIGIAVGLVLDLPSSRRYSKVVA